MKIGVTLIAATLFASLGCWSLGNGTNNPASAATPPQSNMEDQNSTKGIFFKNLPKDFQMPTDEAGKLLLREYGSVFLARGGAIPPKKVVFADEADVAAFQASLEQASMNLGGINIQLQAAAMAALQNAVAEARKAGLSITPRGADSARRGYRQTVTLWASRVNPGLAHWTGKGKITKKEADRIRALTPFEQVPEILSLEQDGIYFAKSLDKSIIYSVAPPGTSQHLSMLALDVSQFNDASVRDILAKHGWFQTVTSDLPHFTYIGVSEAELTGLGLKKVINSGRPFWVPDI